MKELLLIPALGVLFGFGYFVMRRIDLGLMKMKRRKAFGTELEPPPRPACILLPGDLEEQEVLASFREYRKRYPNAKIVLYAEEPSELPKKSDPRKDWT